jgi:Domain of unknown function (DUF4331)
VAGVRTERNLTSKDENVSDHLDAPGLKSPNMDARVDITDNFAFQNPANPTRSVLAMNVNPLAPTLAESFAPEAVYELILDTDSDAVADVTYRVTFSPRENGDQKATVRRATGEETRTAEISGEVLFRNVLVSFDGDAGVVESGDYEFFVGIPSNAQTQFGVTDFGNANGFDRFDRTRFSDFGFNDSGATVDVSGNSSTSCRSGGQPGGRRRVKRSRLLF